MGAVTARTVEHAGILGAGQRLGRYEILAKLAAGGMAVVYIARAQGVAGFERLVAIKVLHANLAHEEEFISMFLDEARLAARIRHPNVVSTIDISDSPVSGYFLVMEYVEGDHLGQLLASAHKSSERLPVPVVLRVVVDALAGLGAAHDLTDDNGKPLNLVHRDVSPHNILVGRDGVSRLTDFGVAKAEDRLTHTRDGQVKGKLAYMAPEQASSGRTDSRSDLFSVGIILWECLTGRRLFRAESTAATLNKLLHEVIPAPSTVDPVLAPIDLVVKRALERDPAKRFQRVDDFIEALEQVAPSVGGMASLRAVGQSVKQLAAEKLKRDKWVVQEAVRKIASAVGEETPLDSDAVSEPSSMSANDVSLSSSSLSVSKLSGVFAHATSPGMTLPQGGVGAASPQSPSPIGAGRLPPPPPIGAGRLPLAASTRTSERSSKASLLGRNVLLLACVVASAGVGAWWFTRNRPQDQESVRVVQIAPAPHPVVVTKPIEPVPVVAPPAASALPVQNAVVAVVVDSAVLPPADAGQARALDPAAVVVVPGAEAAEPHSGSGAEPALAAKAKTARAPRSKPLVPSTGSPATSTSEAPKAPKPASSADDFIPNPYKR